MSEPMEKSIETGKSTKRPISAFIFFLREYRVNNKASGVSVGETAKDAALKWKSMSEADQKPFRDLAAKDKTRYESDIASGMVAASKKAKVSKKKGVKSPKDPNAPKKASTAYLCFLADYRKNAGTTLTGAKLVSKAAQEWKTLSENDKKKFVNLEQEDKKRYAAEMEKYKSSGAASKFEASKKALAKTTSKRGRKPPAQRTAATTTASKKVAKTLKKQVESEEEPESSSNSASEDVVSEDEEESSS